MIDVGKSMKREGEGDGEGGGWGGAGSLSILYQSVDVMLGAVLAV